MKKKKLRLKKKCQKFGPSKKTKFFKIKMGVITSLYLQEKCHLYTPTYHGWPKACLRPPLPKKKKSLALRKKTASSL